MGSFDFPSGFFESSGFLFLSPDFDVDFSSLAFFLSSASFLLGSCAASSDAFEPSD